MPTTPAPEMNAIICLSFGAPEVMRLAQLPMPVPKAGEVLIKVSVAGINRADVLQRSGKYPPPPGASDIMGLEVAGVIEALGEGVTRWRIGDRVCALLAGGGYAEYAVAPEGHCLPVPQGVTLKEAAALPEAIATVYANVFEDGRFKSGETVLVHRASGGVGTMAISMIKALGGKVIATVGSPEKAEMCTKIGADLCIEYNRTDFTVAVEAETKGRGVDIVLDSVGGSYLNRNMRVMAHGGRHVSIATQQGLISDISLPMLIQRHLTLTGSTLRSRDKVEKARLIAEIEAKIWPFVADDTIKPVIYQSFTLKTVVEAHKVMESSAHIGKMVIEIT